MTWVKSGSEQSVEEVFLKHIGVAGLDDINDWFRKSYAGGYRLDGIAEAVRLALSFRHRPVVVVGDYDGDGMTSTAILMQALGRAGFTNIRYRIPRRFTEGFGINDTIVAEIPEGLVITCDNGIGQRDVIQRAKDKGLTVIVLDHHLPDREGEQVLLPPADVVVDPKAIAGSADFLYYCGAGLCYRFALELLAQAGISEKTFENRLLGLAAVGTVMDVVPLREENYVLVRNGLQVLNRRELCSTGLWNLMDKQNLTGHITAHDIGFKLGPALNALSRLQDDGADDAVELLLFDGDVQEARTRADTVERINERKKSLRHEGIARAKAMAAMRDPDEVPRLIYLPDTAEGIVGIIAGALCEEYRVPVIVVTDKADEPDVLKGSARSVEGYHMKEALDAIAPLLIRYGGHEGAAGLSFARDRLEEVREALCRGAAGFTPSPKEHLTYDLEITADRIPDVMQELKRYEPYGEGNPVPVFKITQYPVVPYRGALKSLMGADQSIVKFYSQSGSAVGFGLAEQLSGITEPHALDLIGCLAENYFNGRAEIQVEFTDCIQSA